MGPSEASGAVAQGYGSICCWKCVEKFNIHSHYNTSWRGYRGCTGEPNAQRYDDSESCGLDTNKITDELPKTVAGWEKKNGKMAIKLANLGTSMDPHQ